MDLYVTLFGNLELGTWMQRAQKVQKDTWDRSFKEIFPRKITLRSFEALWLAKPIFSSQSEC